MPDTSIPPRQVPGGAAARAGQDIGQTNQDEPAPQNLPICTSCPARLEGLESEQIGGSARVLQNF